METNKVYIVISDFNDCGEVTTNVEGVFNNKEEAEKLCDIINNYKPCHSTQSVNAFVFETHIGWKNDAW